MLKNLYEGLNAQKCNGCSNQKIKKKVHLFFNFASGRTLPTHENVYEGLNALKCI